ncbi:MAG: hypothetical protein J7527_06990 [Chitinophagaceae bacterium]|nr:hypothetical protein [Chitinophagaceae bacterium]
MTKLEQIAHNNNGAASSITIDAVENTQNDLAFDISLTDVQTAINKTIDMGDGWLLQFSSPASGDFKFKIQFNKDGLKPSNNRGDLTMKVTKRPADANALLIGDANGTHFSTKEISLSIVLRSIGPLFEVGINLSPINFVVKPDFLGFINFGITLPSVISFNSDLSFSYLQGKGLSGQSENNSQLGVQFTNPLNLHFGSDGNGISIDHVVTRIEIIPSFPDLYFKTSFRVDAKGQFGPLRFIMDEAGAWIGKWNNGNAGPLPPKGIGLSLEAGPVNGGGFLKVIRENEFAGVLNLKILGIGAFAYALYKKLPSGDISFVTIIGVRLPVPGIQIGFGFAVSGFGGLVGVNRYADTDRIRERLAAGSAGDVLFNDDPMRNAPRLLADMQQFFPDEQGIFLIGPTFQLNWLYILKLDAGLFIELPGPRKFFFAGSARLVIGSEEFALVYLRMDFVGGIDTVKSLIFFDAALVNSHVLGIFRITGGVALRIAYGQNGFFLFSVGGFHPSFNPESIELPVVPRVGVSYSYGPVWMKSEMYLAVTSNTFQLGAKIEAGLNLDPIAAHGWFGFDALVQFKPFYFIAEINAGFDVEVDGVSLCNVQVHGNLSGPGPLVLSANASVHVLMVKASGHLTIELNSNPPEQIIPITNIPKYLKDQKELSIPDNFRSENEDQSVVFKQMPEGAKLYNPGGYIIWEQKRVPLELSIEKMEGVQLGGWHYLKVIEPINAIKETDWFGVGTYLNLTDSEILNNARFSCQQSGVKFGSEVKNGPTQNALFEIQLYKLPQRQLLELFSVLAYENEGLIKMNRERSMGAKFDPGKARVNVFQENWTAYDKNGKVLDAGPLNDIQAFVKAKQVEGIAIPGTERSLNLNAVL